MGMTSNSEGLADEPIIPAGPVMDIMKVTLGILIVIVVVTLLRALSVPFETHYTGGGVVKTFASFGSGACYVTVTQDDGFERGFNKMSAPDCSRYYIGSRVYVTNGKLN